MSDVEFPETKAAVAARLSYLRPMRQKPHHYMYPRPPEKPTTNADFDEHVVTVRDARQSVLVQQLDVCGFELVEHFTSVTDFNDGAQIQARLYPEAAEIALEATGGRHAFVFDHTYRKREPGRPKMTFGRSHSLPSPIGYVHNDYTEESGRKRFEAIMAMKPEGRFSIVNIWRSIAGTVKDTPLALCDSRSVRAHELVTTDIRYQDRVGEVYMVTGALSHRWSYYSHLEPTEAIIFKQFDSSGKVSRFTPHAAFNVPVPEGAPLRESIELRIIVIY